ncbi:hypothetical protein AFLA_010764 [Aspergillus flavus NRRL3357]|nr:hypothetical protein AFLA_010764 [Aspergillus flavus NRRL3357]
MIKHLTCYLLPLVSLAEVSQGQTCASFSQVNRNISQELVQARRLLNEEGFLARQVFIVKPPDVYCRFRLGEVVRSVGIAEYKGAEIIHTYTVAKIQPIDPTISLGH